MNIKDDFILKDINEGYLVGGYVRDFLMGLNISNPDRDIAILGAEKFAKKIAEKFDATFIVLDKENQIYRVVLKDKENYLDISELRGKTIEEDLMQRDFTVNAIAYDLDKKEFVDATGGIEDIKNKQLRYIKTENFTDDPLRILRAYRFMATTGFEPDNRLRDALVKHKNLISKPAKERIEYELMKLFGGKNCSDTLLCMYEDGILELIFPCVKDIEKIPSNSHHHLDLIHHLIETVKQVEIIYEQSENEVREHLNNIDFGGFPRLNHLKLAAFLHDIGKPSTWTIEDTGRHRFIKHDLEGAKLVIPLLKNLKFSNKQIDYVSEMIKNHIYPSSVIASPNLDTKVMMRYVRKMGNNAIDNIILAKADRLSAQGEAVTKEMTENNLNGLNKLLDFYLQVQPTLKPLPKLIDGNEIMQILSIKQSPKLGEIINKVKEAQLNGDINTKSEAIDYIKTI